MTRVAPAKVRAEAKLGLELHKKWKRGGTNVGVARAVQLASGKVVSDNTIKRMRAYFLRHQHDRLDKDGSDGSIPGRGYIAWLLWGGWSGRKWAESEYKKLGGKKKNPISKPVKKIKEDLAKKTIYLIQVTLDDYRSEPWAQEMVTKEEDFEVVDNYTDSGEPIFKTCEYVLSVVPKKYLQDFEFLRQMQMEGKLEKHSFSSAARAWLENDQPLDWFNEQAQDRGYLTKDEYLFLRKVNNPTISDSVEERKKYFIELAKECQSRPKWDTKDGLQLTRFLRDDKNFKAKIKELCPQWFKGDTGPTQKTLEMMEYIRELAKSGAPRPPKDSKDPDERKLGANIVNLFTTYPKFREEIQELRPDWFYESVKDEVTARKNYFVELARECQSRPKKYTKDGQQLTRFLQTDKNFKAKIKELCPQWFRGDTGPTQKTLELMEYVRELAKSGAPKPSDRSKDPDERKLGISINGLFRIYPKFRAEILALRPDWFMGEERRMFAEYKEENPFKMMNPARNVANVEDVKKFCEEALEEFDEALGYNVDEQKYIGTKIGQWFKSNFFKGIMNSERTETFFPKLDKENFERYYPPYPFSPSDIPEFAMKAINEGKEIRVFRKFFLHENGYFPTIDGHNIQFRMEHFADFFNSDDFPADASRVSYDQMIQLVLDWDGKNKKKEIQELVKGDEKVFIEYPNGIKWVQLFSRKALENEGVKMGGICIGSASNHLVPIRKGDHLAFSLRDADNKPYVSVEYIVNDVGYGDAGTVREAKGYSNERINERRIEPTGNQKYVKDLFLKLPNHDIEASFDSGNPDFHFKNIELLYINGRILTLDEFESGNFKDLKYHGDLDLSGSKIENLPKGLHVYGGLNIDHCQSLIYLPKGLLVDGILTAESCKSLEEIADGIVVENDCNFSNCTSLEKIPKNMKVGGSLNLSFCEPLESIPDGLEISDGDLIVVGCTNLKSIGNIKIGGSLSAINCHSLVSLPDNLYIPGSADLSNCTGLRSLPKGLKVGRNLYLSNCNSLESLPDDLEVEGDLHLNGCTSLIKTNNPTISESLEEKKKYLIELARECGERPKRDTKYGKQLDIFLTRDENFKAKIKELCPQWFKGDRGSSEETLELMEYVRELAKSGEPRPRQFSKDPDERKLGISINGLFTRYPKFREEIQELRPDWFYESVKDEVIARKNYFVELARECQSRPKWGTKDGYQLSRFLQTDKNFKAKIKELCPQWFRGDTGPTQKTLELMEYVRELAKSGAPKPSDRSKDPDERKLGKNISSLFARYPKFREEILALRPDWFMTEERTRFAEYKEENPFKMMNPARNVANVEDVKKGNPETPKEITDIKEYLKTVSSLKPFKALFKWQLKVCEPVNIISYKDDPEIKNMVDQFLKKKKVKMKGCYENSFNIANTFPEIECVFGYAMNEASIEHSWNCYKGKHFDLTSEIVLKDQPFKKNYLQIIKMDAKKALDYFQKINMIDSLIRPYYFTEVDKGMKKNPLSSTEEKTNEYLPIVQESLQTHEKSLEAWVDEKTNDILIGTMSFEEDRSFDDVLIRIKTTGQIKEGESVDDGIRPAVQNLMKKVHKDLVEYVTNKKGNPIPEKYLKGSTDREERKKELEKNLKAHQKGESKFSDKDWATDFDESGERIETVPSKYTEAFHKKYNPSSLDKAIKNKAKECGVPLTIARAVVKRGQAAWASGHRPGTTPEQWGLARLNSFCVGGKTTKTADRDLFDKWKKKVR